VHLHSANWDDLVQLLRSRMLDFFVAETSLLSLEPDLDVGPTQLTHPVYFIARAGHPLARSGDAVRATDIFAWPFATPSRIPPRMLDPLLAAHRASTARDPMPRAFPAIECNGLAPVKRIVACSDAVSASILPSIANELDNGQFVLLGTEPWLYLQYGVVSLRGRPWTQAAEKLREFALQAEQEATQLEQQLLERHSPGGSARRKSMPRSRRTPARDGRRQAR